MLDAQTPTAHPRLRQRGMGGAVGAGTCVAFWLVFHVTSGLDLSMPAVVGFVFGALVTPGRRGGPRADFWLWTVGGVVLALNVLFFVSLLVSGTD